MVHECIKQDSLVEKWDKPMAEIGQALAHPIRIAILRLLADGERCACEIASCFDLDQSGISRHLSTLRRAGLITSRRDGIRIYWCLSSLVISELLHLLETVVKGSK